MNLLQKISFILLLTFTGSIGNITFADTDSRLNLAESFVFFAKQFKGETPESYKYIHLNFSGVPQDSDLEDALQILIYKNLIPNTETKISGEKLMNLYAFEKLAEKIVSLKVSDESPEIDKKLYIMQESDLENIQQALIDKRTAPKITINSSLGNASNTLGKEGKILEDVYKTLKSSHYDRNEIDDTKIIQGAIQGMADAVGDKYTSYFPPTESNDFLSGLEGEYEGIGAYVDMQSPGEFIIVSPIVGSPSEKAGIKGGDRVIKVDENLITEENSINEIISWIKGPAGSTVELTIVREGVKDELTITVTREKIIINDVEYSKKDRSTAYIQIKNFGDKVDGQFKLALEEIKADSSIKKIIFDVRNNPGGYLNKVSNMLGYFIPNGEATAIVSYGDNDLEYTSLGLDVLDIEKYEIIALQNGGSASASEIFVGSLKDYFPNLTIIGEQSFGKGSVQTLKSYYDGSTLKYTTARWYTGKSRTGIDKIGITPDIEVIFDDEKWEKYKTDNQLEKAMKQ